MLKADTWMSDKCLVALFKHTKSVTICEIKEITILFQLKLERLISTEIKNELQYFPEFAHTLASVGRAQSKCPKIVQLAIQDLLKKFDWRFHILNDQEQSFNIVYNPFQFSVDFITKVNIIQKIFF